MSKGQQQFRDFLMRRVRFGRKAEMDALITDFFKRQNSGSLTKAYIAETDWQIVLLLRPECVEEYKMAVQQAGLPG